METHIKFKYMGSALPGNAETVTLFTTAPTGTAPFATYGAFLGANMLDSSGISRIMVRLQNDQAGTLKAYKSNDRGVTWVRVEADVAVAAAAANAENIHDYLVEGYADWRLDWTNGATPQTTFRPDISGVGQRHIGN